MPAVDEIVVIQAFGPAAAIDAKDLAYPAYFAVWLDADGELKDLVRFVIKRDALAVVCDV